MQSQGVSSLKETPSSNLLVLCSTPGAAVMASPYFNGLVQHLQPIEAGRA
jgi:hypothetical protein